MTERQSSTDGQFRAVVLCAGFGERLGNVAKGRHKSLMPLGGSLVLDEIVSRINVPTMSCAVVVHNAHWQKDFRRWSASLVSLVSDGPKARLPRIRLVNNLVAKARKRRGAVADLALGLRKADATDVLVVPGDTVFDWAIGDFLAGIDRSRPTIALCRVPASERAELGAVTVDNVSGTVTRLAEKPSNAGGGLVWLGPMWLPRSFRHYVALYCEEAARCGTTPDRLGGLVTWLIDHAIDVGFWIAPGRAFDVGTPRTYWAAVRHFEAKQRVGAGKR